MEHSVVRRKRSCESCSKEFVTLERAHFSKVWVLNKFGQKAAFDYNKLFSAIRKSDKSGSIPDEILHCLVDSIAKSFAGSKKSVTKDEIVERASSLLFEIDPLTAARFVCMHKNFMSVSNMADAILEITNK